MYFIHDPHHNNNIYFVFVVLLLLEQDLFLNIDLVQEQQYYIDCSCSAEDAAAHFDGIGMGFEGDGRFLWSSSHWITSWKW